MTMKQVKNNYGIAINVACMSCMYKEVDSKNKRVCTLHHITVDKNGFCDDWSMDRACASVGRGKKKLD